MDYYNFVSCLWDVSQVRKDMKRIEMPKRKIPEWFDYVNGGYPVFEARGKFPTVALVFVFGKEKFNPKPYHN